MYIAFENPDLSIDIILQIGKVIQHDFANEIKQIRNFEREIFSANINEPNETFHGNRNSEFWKNKYLSLLEKYNQLLESKTSSSTKKYPVRKKNK